MANKDLISTQLNIAGRNYPVKLTESEEKVASFIEKEINKKINDFQIRYKELDKNDILVMVLLTYAFEMHKNKTTNDKLLDQKISVLEKLVDDHNS